MSRNFELLQRAEKAGLLASISAPPAEAAAGNGREQDEIAKLVQRLYLHEKETHKSGIVCFSGISGHKRSSWICAKVGQALAGHTQSPVCLVDANFGFPKLHSQLNIPNRLGLADALASHDAIMRFATRLPAGNIWVIPSGVIKAGQNIASESWRDRFRELRKQFEYVLVCAPAVNGGAGAVQLGQLSDGFVLIVEAHETRRKELQLAKDRLESAEIQVLGAVLDQRRFPIPAFLYRKL